MKVLIVDDHPLYRDGLAALIMQLFEHACVEQAGDAATALERLDGSDTVDLVLLDLKLPGADGRSALLEVRRRHPAVPVVVISVEEDAATIRGCMDAGASGYIPKSARKEIVCAALAVVADGGLYMPPAMRASVAGNPTRPLSAPSLTSRELEVLQRLCAGEPSKAIGRRLGISEATVRAHLGAIFRALGVANRTQAAVEARRLGLADTGEPSRRPDGLPR